jgi:hypothetical protein
VREYLEFRNNLPDPQDPYSILANISFSCPTTPYVNFAGL